MIYGSVCSGIEAASVAWEPLGWTPRFFAEIEPFPSAVLAHRFPGVPNLGDFTKIGEEHGPVELLVGGTPCQSFSVAGKRLGLDDPRGNLSLEYLALARRLRPRWLVFENVPGLLSSDEGRDFGAFLGAMGELGYGFAYRVLDAQHFGVPQRRRRVFVVGYSGGWGPAAAVLLERTCLLRNPPTSGEEGEGVAGCLEACAATGGHDPGAHGAASGHLIPSLMGSGAGMERPAGLPAEADYLVSSPAKTVMSSRGQRNNPAEDQASEDGTGRGTPLVPVAFDPTQITHPENRSKPKPGGPAPTLAKGAHPPAVAYRVHGEHSVAMTGKGKARVADEVETARSLDSCGGYATNQGGNVVATPVTFPVLGADYARQAGGHPGVEEYSAAMLAAGSAVRRLTPRECERLQGFPDDWTLVPVRGKPAADGPRYRAIGNSMAVPVMSWIGKRIAMVEKILEAKA